MWVADMDFPAPDPILNALRKALDLGMLGYDLEVKSLQRAAAARMGHLYNWQVEPDMVVVVPGIVSGFNAAAWTVCPPGSGILMQVPVYYPFLDVHQHVSLVQQSARLRQVRQDHTLKYDIDFPAFDAALDSGGAQTRMFLLCNPHNPTGNMFNRDELAHLAERCLERDVIICSDEIHSELILSGQQHIPMAVLSPEISDHTITLVSPSKTFNIPGLFCGLAIISNAELREKYRKQLERLTMHANSLGILAAQAAFSGECDDWLLALRSYLKSNRDYVTEVVRDRLPGIRTTIPDATYLAWLDCNDLIAEGRIKGSAFEFFLNEARVALNDGAPFGSGDRGFVRLNFGCPRSLLVQALERMEKSLYRRGS